MAPAVTLSIDTLSAIVLHHANAIRMLAFAFMFIMMAGWEWRRPRRARLLPRARRWPGNLAIVALAAAFTRVMLPLSTVAMATIVTDRGWGLLSLSSLPMWQCVLLSLIALDLAVYGQHVLMHAVPVLWRLHRVHHCDPDVDVTTGARFHPLEIVLSTVFKLLVIAALGVPALAVILFEVLLNGTSLFNHGNVGLRPGLEALVRSVLVTPDMHRIHHSVRVEETNSNFGFCLSWWDRVCGTYRADARDGQDGLTFGVADFHDPQASHLTGMLTQPFRQSESAAHSTAPGTLTRR